MKENYQIYLNLLACFLILCWTIYNFTCFLRDGFCNQSEQISEYSKTTAIIVGLYAGIYCISALSLDKYGLSINITAILAVSTLMFSSANFSQDLWTIHSAVGFVFLFMGNAAIFTIFVALVKFILKFYNIRISF